MSKTLETAERPLSITVICVIGLLDTLTSVQVIVSPMAQRIATWYPTYLGISVVVGLACIIGLWMMKKWAAYTYVVLLVIELFVWLTIGAWDGKELIILAAVIFFTLKSTSRMT